MHRPLVLVLGLLAPAAAMAQTPPPDPRAAAEIIAGYAGFIDESLIGHGLVSAAARYRLARHLSIGPEIVHMAGPGADRDLFLTGNATIDFLLRPAADRRGSVTPFLVAGAGLMRHSTRIGPQAFSSWEGAFTVGAGARVWITSRVYAVGEYRLGWEPHVRASGGVGAAW